MKPITKEFQFGAHRVVLETGEIARQADGAVMVNMGDTVVLCTVVGSKTADPGRDFFPPAVIEDNALRLNFAAQSPSDIEEAIKLREEAA